jgi:transposase InsO family protein
MQERHQFIADWLDRDYLSFAELCASYGISRKTGYKWVNRFKSEGLTGLADRPRGCPKHPMLTDKDMVELVVAYRRHRPGWGPKKLCAALRKRGHKPPAESTVGQIIKREGLINPRRRRKPRNADYSSHLSAQNSPNAVWAVDFKGWFRLGSGQKCYPLTVSDGYSRYLLGCEALEHPDGVSSRAVFETLFTQFGLPNVIRSDNGTPFSGRYGLSALSVWWVKLGIRPERIQRGKPSQNGRHERMHRTLKEDAIQSGPLGYRTRTQQQIFDHFRREYNEERPHEALGQRPPAELYEVSNRCYPQKPTSPEYPKSWDVHVVSRDGSIALPGRKLQLTPLLKGEPVGLEAQEDGTIRVKYGPLTLGSLSCKGKYTRGTRAQGTRNRSNTEELRREEGSTSTP